MDLKRFRQRVVHGWAFRDDLSKEDETNIQKYLATGDREFLPENYKRIAKALEKRNV